VPITLVTRYACVRVRPSSAFCAPSLNVSSTGCADDEATDEGLLEELKGQQVAEPEAEPVSREAAEVADGAPGATVHAALAAAAEEATEIDKDVRFEDDCIVIAQSDIIDAMAEFIAQCVVLNPNAAKLSPEKLQAALTKSINELQRGQVGTLLEWSKRIYRGGAWGYGVAHAYTHPWVRFW
jgi:hypothetical protein